MRKSKPELDYRFSPVPVEMLNHERLAAIDVAAWIVMWDASREGLCTISELRLGQRLRRSEETARRIVKRLATTGWIEIIDPGNGLCRSYRLLTPSICARGARGTTPGINAGGTLSIGAADPSHFYPRTPSTDAAHPRVPLDISLESEELKNDEERRHNIRRLRTIANEAAAGKRITEAVA